MATLRARSRRAFLAATALSLLPTLSSGCGTDETGTVSVQAEPDAAVKRRFNPNPDAKPDRRLRGVAGR